MQFKRHEGFNSKKAILQNFCKILNGLSDMLKKQFHTNHSNRHLYTQNLAIGLVPKE